MIFRTCHSDFRFVSDFCFVIPSAAEGNLLFLARLRFPAPIPTIHDLKISVKVD
jgi:hypothetical protein